MEIIATAWTLAWILCDPTGLWGFLSQGSPVITIGWNIPVVMVMTTGWSAGTPMTKRKPPPEKCSKALLHRNSHNGLWYILIYCESWTFLLLIDAGFSRGRAVNSSDWASYIYIYKLYIYMYTYISLYIYTILHIYIYIIHILDSIPRNFQPIGLQISPWDTTPGSRPAGSSRQRRGRQGSPVAPGPRHAVATAALWGGDWPRGGQGQRVYCKCKCCITMVTVTITTLNSYYNHSITMSML